MVCVCVNSHGCGPGGVRGGSEVGRGVQSTVSSQKSPSVCRLFLSSASLRLSPSDLAFEAAFLFFCCLVLAVKMQNMLCREEEGWVLGLPVAASAEVLFPEDILSVDGVLLN